MTVRLPDGISIRVAVPSPAIRSIFTDIGSVQARVATTTPCPSAAMATTCS